MTAAHCLLCGARLPAHRFACWHLLSPSRPAYFAPDAEVASLVDVRFAHQREATVLRQLADACPDPETAAALRRRADGHEALSTVNPQR